jgi:hypothetical protein
LILAALRWLGKTEQLGKVDILLEIGDVAGKERRL